MLGRNVQRTFSSIEVIERYLKAGRREEGSSCDKEEELLFAEREHLYFCYLAHRKCMK